MLIYRRSDYHTFATRCCYRCVTWPARLKQGLRLLTGEGYVDCVLIYHSDLMIIIEIGIRDNSSPRGGHLIRGGSNSIVLQYYRKVLQYFGISTSQNNSISIAKSQSIAILIATFSSIAKSIAKFFKYYK